MTSGEKYPRYLSVVLWGRTDYIVALSTDWKEAPVRRIFTPQKEPFLGPGYPRATSVALPPVETNLKTLFQIEI